MVVRSLVVLGWLFGLVLAGCGSSDGAVAGTASCTIMQMVSSGGQSISQQICEEGTSLTAAQAEQLRQQCVVPGGGAGGGIDAGVSQQATFRQGPCPRENAIGGCRLTQAGVTVTAWYYQMLGFDAASIQQLCAAAGGTFVAP